MSNRDSAHSLTVRLPRDLYLAARNIAVKCGKSMNILVQESLRRAIEAEEQEELRRGFELLSESPAECDVEYASEAQSEVVLRDDPSDPAEVICIGLTGVGGKAPSRPEDVHRWWCRRTPPIGSRDIQTQSWWQ